MALAGNTAKEDERKVMQMCAFDINISDSQFELHDEVVGACNPEDGTECPETETTPDDPSNPRRSGFNGSDEADPNYELGSEEGKAKKSQNGPVGSGSDSNLEKQVYIGLPPPSQTKHYRTDYPTGLRLKKICSPKHPGMRRTVDNYRTQAVASFSPVASEENLQTQGGFKSDDRGSQDQEGYMSSVKKGNKCQQRVRDLPPIVSVSDEEVIDYLEDNNIQMLFEYFLGLCVLETPEDPFQYIADISTKLIKARTDETAFANLPRLLTPDHVDSMFRIYDRVGTGFINFNQYQNAFASMGLVRFNQEPEGCDADKIGKDTFVTEANNAINELLRSFMAKTVRVEGDC